ncbi:MAG: FKBP-type peptidyl-prolyl cis-trans isomerase [Crocinitomicaceae bacterium]|jgi:FKBP-type peptidyl-prolyl cis-trans isomerase
MKLGTGILVLLVSFTWMSCDPEGVVNDGEEPNGKKDLVENDPKIPLIDQVRAVKDTLNMPNGITIKWFEHGKGEKMTYGDFYAIDYRVMIENGDIIDGNHLLKKESLPFTLGFEMQTSGWELALSELKVGDFAEIFLPSEFARGELGIEGLVPPNSDNILKIRILEKIKPTRVIDGNKVWIFEKNEANTLGFDDGQEVTFHTISSSQSSPRYLNTYIDGRPFSMKLEDYGLVPGLKKALINAKKSDRMFVFVPSSEGYKSKGYLDLVKPNEDLLYSILIMDVVDK